MKRAVLAAGLAGLAGLAAAANQAPVVSNVTASQREGTKLVDIHYDISDADGDLMKVRVEISSTDGVQYSVPAFSLTGDVGEGIASGTGKHIVWDAEKDWDGEYSDRMRVKVFAIDAKGYPGMEWGNEVPPGGFLMGQDGRAEGSGPSRHVTIKWPFWMAKYEVTCRQYCDFLNMAVAVGQALRVGTELVVATKEMDYNMACPPGSPLIQLGDDKQIRWNVNNFEVTPGQDDYPACTTWYGAMAFCRFYGYDLPTSAEWEKAVRGAEWDDEDEHRIYPWADQTVLDINAYASIGKLTPVGYYDGNQAPIGPDTANGYGLYDVVGNAGEWTRTIGEYGVENYPAVEDLRHPDNDVFSSLSNRVFRGTATNHAECVRQRYRISQDSYTYGMEIEVYNETKGGGYKLNAGTGEGLEIRPDVIWTDWKRETLPLSLGFRPCRRVGAVDSGVTMLTREGFESFNLGGSSTTVAKTTEAGKWELIKCTVADGAGVGGGKGVVLSVAGGSVLKLPDANWTDGRELFRIRFKARSLDGEPARAEMWFGSTPRQFDLSGGEFAEMHVECEGYKGKMHFRAAAPATGLAKDVVIDDIEIWTRAK